MVNAITDNISFKEIPLMPLRGMLVFPYMLIHLDVGREKSMIAVEEAMLTEGKNIFLTMQKDPQVDNPTVDDVYAVGVVAEVRQTLKLPGGTMRVLVQGVTRAKIETFIDSEDCFKVVVSDYPSDVDCSDVEMEALSNLLINDFTQYGELNKKLTPETVLGITEVEDPEQLADSVAACLLLKLDEKQQILEEAVINKRIELLISIISRELEIMELELKISMRVRHQMEKGQKEYYLREQIKAIQKELGDKDERQAEIEELKAKIKKTKLSKEALEKVNKELGRLERMPAQVAEAMVVRNYIDWMLDTPWKIESKDKQDLANAQQILDQGHYGLETVKERIIEYLAGRQLSKSLKGPILCLVGPPGVGKTSLAKSIADALGRKFVRMSLGSVKDEAEIRGHRRTYIGAMPGRIIQGMKTAGTCNPVFLLDEVDKMNTDYHGDPSSALLEVLDPEQNNTFSDHYLEIPYDLSKVMFITTANVMQDIPRPLLDRMEVVELNSYTEEEKLHIALEHLIPKQYTEHNLTAYPIKISENAVRNIIREYTRESGVRSLERSVGKICRKVVKQIVLGEKGPFEITAKNLSDYLGIPRFHYGVTAKEPQIGVVTGLAWTSVGGELLEIECQTLQGKGKMTITGQLGDVMKESAQAGFTYIRSIGKELGIAENIEETTDFHIHVPEGGIPKDGPSAGITMATALASQLTGRPVKSNLAMTGEVTIRGRVLPIGGVKEKVLAAYRGCCTEIILPSENKKDLEDVPANIRKKIQFHFVDQMSQVLPIALLERK